jgi:hypothetical protein
VPTLRILAALGLLAFSFLMRGQTPPAQTQPMTAELNADEARSDPADYISGDYGPETANSCNVVLHVVQAKTMTPIENVQVAIDTTYNQNDPDPPQYTVWVRSNGLETFLGGHVHNIKKKVHSGVVSLGAPPAYFMLNVNVVEPGHSSDMGLVHRRCLAPTTDLLYVVNDYGQPDESGHFQWVKSEKFAAPAAR